MEDWIIDGVRYTTEPTELCYDDLKALSDKRLVLLRRLEWTPDEMNDYYCPICYQDRDQGHTDDCELAEAIDAA